MTPLAPLVKGGIQGKILFISESDTLTPSPYQGEGWGGVIRD